MSKAGHRQGLGAWLACALAAISLSSACKEDGHRAVIAEDASFGRRVFKAPAGEVRALPPHNIHSSGVGPYELGASFQKTLALLPNGPRVELFKAEGLFDYRLMRADNDALVLGVGRHNLVEFISVLDPDIARTESGVGVGAGLEELIGALGEVRARKNGGRDSRIVTFESLPDTRFLVENQKVVAAVVMPGSAGEVPATAPGLAPASPPATGAGTGTGASTRGIAGSTGITIAAPVIPALTPATCRAETLLERRAEILKFARMSSKKSSVVPGCLTGDEGELIIRSGDQLKIVTGDGAGGFRIWAETEIPGLRFAAIVSTGPGRPDLYTVSQQEDLQLIHVEIARYKLVGGRISSIWSRTAFELEATTASWIGAKIQAADFLIEVQGSDGALIVGGLYVQRDGDSLRMVVPIEDVELPVATSSRPDSGAAPAGSVPSSTSPDASVDGSDSAQAEP